MQQVFLDQLEVLRREVRMLFSWTEKKSGVIEPDERLPWGNTVAMGMQHVLAMFGSTVVAPLIMGFDPNLAILFSGIGTLLFFAITAGKVPSYLGSSFAFIAPVGAVMIGEGGMKAALGGIMAAGLVYLVIGLAVQFTGSGWIDALMPPLVTGAVVAIIGLNLAGAAKNLAVASMPLALITIFGVMAIAILGRGMLGRLPILLGTLFGYFMALLLGGTDVAGRMVGPMHISGVNFQPVRDAAWIGWPNFTSPSFSWNAISLIAPVAIVLVAENTGHIKAVSEMTGRNLMPYLGRGFIGDAVATMVAGAGGGTGVTTYAENIGVMAVTKVFSTAIFVVAAVTAIVLGFCPKFGALIGSIPNAVLGGVSTVLFGLIAVTGVRIWVENRVDFSRSSNLFIAAVALIVGAADYTIHFGDFALAGIGLGTFGAIILYQIFKALGIEDAPLAIDGPIVGVADSAISTRTSGRARGRGARVETETELDPRALRQAFGGTAATSDDAIDEEALYGEDDWALRPPVRPQGQRSSHQSQTTPQQRPPQPQSQSQPRDQRQMPPRGQTQQQPQPTLRQSDSRQEGVTERQTAPPRGMRPVNPGSRPPQRPLPGQQPSVRPEGSGRGDAGAGRAQRSAPQQRPPQRQPPVQDRDPRLRRPPINRNQKGLPDLPDPDDDL